MNKIDLNTPPMPKVNPRRLFYPNRPKVPMWESNKDFVLNNIDAAVWLLEDKIAPVLALPDMVNALHDAMDTLDGVGAFATGKIKEVIDDSRNKVRDALRKAGQL